MVTQDDADIMLRSLEIFDNELRIFVDRYDDMYLAGSQAEKEVNDFTDSSTVKTVYARSSIFHETIKEHFTALYRVLLKPSCILAAITCTRTILELSAKDMWLLDRDINVRERVGRSFALRYSDLEQQRKFAKSLNMAEGETLVNERIDSVENDALKLGYCQMLGKNGKSKGKRVGIGTTVPNNTDMIKNILEGKEDYRFLSAIVHGQMGTTIATAFKEIPDSNILEKHAHEETVYYLFQTGPILLSRIVWNKAQFYGWDVNKWEAVIQPVFDTLGISEQNLSWMKPST